MTGDSTLTVFGGGFARKALDTSLNGLYVHELEAGVHVFINAQYSRLTGYDLARLQAMGSAGFFALFHPDDLPRLLAHIDALRAAADGEVMEVEYRFRRADGTWIWCLSRDSVCERNPDGAVRTIIGTFLDISPRKAAEENLRRSESSARGHLGEIELIYDTAPVGLCVLDRALRFVRINGRLAEINGVPAAHHIGRTVREVLPALAEELEPGFRRVLETGRAALDIEVTGETPARPGVRRTWIESWLPLCDEVGEVVGINIVAREVTEERAALEALAASREHYRLVADYTYDWEDWLGPDGTLRWVSPSCERITGHPPEAFLADPGLLVRITHPEDRPALRRHLEANPCHREVRQLRFRIRRADGQTRWMEHICQPVYWEDGAFAGRRSSTRDITEILETERTLRERERELATLADNSPDIVARFDRALRHRYVNAAVERATGRPAAEFLGKTNEELDMPAELCGLWNRTLREVLDTGKPRSLEFAFPAPDGERFYSLRAVPEPGPDGRVETVLSTTRDETERREAEARVRTLATVVETSADFIGVARLDGRAIYLNRAGQALVGLAGDAEVAETRIEDYLFEEDLPLVRETVLPTVMREGRWAGDFRFRHFRTGEVIDVHWDIVRIDDPETGEPVQLATVTRDIRTEKAAAAALEEAGRRKDEFLTALGHELRNPMAPIRNAVDILHLLRAEHDPRIDWALAVLDRQSTHMSRLLDDLLDVARIARGRLTLERRPVELREVVQQAVDGVRPSMTERRHRLTVDLPAPGVLVDGDPVRLAQILLNLLLNAANYTQEGGEIRVSSLERGGEVIVAVRDNGPGIPQELLAVLFDPFVRGGRRDRAYPGGIGLGLTISRRLAELHGGRLEAESDWPRPGSEFRLRLPRLTAPGQTSRASDACPATAPVALRVLVVDDNPDVAGALSMLLEVLGHQVQTAGSGAEALALVERECPRVALLDIGLPDMDGLELARRLRARCPDRERLLLVAVSGYGHDEARARSLATGFDEHLPKPVDRRTLQALLADLG
jgi:PAS domain S-box-containing protein